MAHAGYTEETDSRRSAMLRTAFCSVVRETLEQDDTIESMANPDGSVWIERFGTGLVLSEHRLESSNCERVIRLVASGTGEAVSSTSPSSLPNFPAVASGLKVFSRPFRLLRAFQSENRHAWFPVSTPKSGGTRSPLPLRSPLGPRSMPRENIVIAGGTSSGKTAPMRC